jgi:two-component system sensor kinase FixL
MLQLRFKPLLSEMQPPANSQPNAMPEGAKCAQATLQALLDGSLDGVILVDGGGRIASANRSAASLFGCRQDEFAGARWQSYIDAPLSVLQAPGVLQDCNGRRADGTIFPIECGFTEIAAQSPRLFVAVIRDISERRLLEQKVLDVSAQLQRQIGQDLHDGLGQLLTGTAFLAKGLVARVAVEYQPQAGRVVELVNQAITRVRSLARGLSPIHIEAQSLDSLLRDVVAESSELLGVECALELRDAVEIDRPATMVQLCLIIREAITNAVRHGQARRIVVSLARQGARSLLQIEDDGVGIGQPNERVDGLGLRSMRHRARMIRGTLTVERGGIGTIVRCSWTD